MRVVADGTTTIQVQWNNLTNAELDVVPGQFIKIENFGGNTFVNGIAQILTAPVASDTCTFQVYNIIGTDTWNWDQEGPGASISISKASWKEVGVLGAETLRTETETPGDLSLIHI